MQHMFPFLLLQVKSLNSNKDFFHIPYEGGPGAFGMLDMLLA